MRKIVGSVALTLVVVAGSAGAQTNLVSNGSLNWQSADGWPIQWGLDGGSCIPETDPAGFNPSGTAWNFTGYNSFAIGGPREDKAFTLRTKNCSAAITQSISVVDGLTYDFSTFYQTTGGSIILDPGFGPCTVTQNGPLTAGDAWIFYAATCTATTTGPANLRLGGGAPNGNRELYYSFDDVSVTAAPEPSSLALLATGLVGLVPPVRRRRLRIE